MLLRRALLALATSLTIITFSLYISIFSPPEPSPPRLSNLDAATSTRLRALAVNNTLVIVPVNTGMLAYAFNLLCSLSATTFPPHSILFWTLDLPAKRALDAQGYQTYHNPSFYAVSTNENLNHDTSAFKKMMLERPKFFIDVLSTGLDILFLDADTIFTQSPLILADPAVDAVFSSDSREFFTNRAKDPFKDIWRRGSRIPPVCNGIFYMKSSPRTIALWQTMLDVFDAGWRTFWWRLFSFKDDQRGMDVLLNDGRARLVAPLPEGITPAMLENRYEDDAELDIRLLDQTMVVSGHLLKNRREQYEENLERLRLAGGEKVSVHLNWDTKEMTKEKGARQMGLWLLDQDGGCKV